MWVQEEERVGSTGRGEVRCRVWNRGRGRFLRLR